MTYEEKIEAIKKMSLEELKKTVYEMGIDEAYENPNITREELLDYCYDYIEE